MRKINRLGMAVFLAGVALATVGCIEGDVDDGDSADVLLQIAEQPTVPPVTGADDGTGTCVYTVTEATVSLKNTPKSALVGTSAMQGIQVHTLNITYTGIPFSPRSVPIGVTIDPGTTKSVRFIPYDPVEFASVPFSGAAVSMNLQFVGQTLAGETVVAIGGASGAFNACLADDGDGVPAGFDNCPAINNPTQQDCDADGDGAECDQDGGDVIPPAACP